MGLANFIASAARALGGENVNLAEVAKSLQAAIDLAESGVDPFPDAAEDEKITIPVDSTCLAIVQYEPQAETLRLLFQSGVWYRFSGVSAETTEELVEASS